MLFCSIIVKPNEKNDITTKGGILCRFEWKFGANMQRSSDRS